MGRLIKYELKKQQTSRNIILALLLVFLLAFAAGIFSDNGNMVGISMGLEIFVGMFVFFYMGIESLLILNRDLKTKQSHMLWMVPMPSWKILGAKYIAAALQIFCISAENRRYGLSKDRLYLFFIILKRRHYVKEKEDFKSELYGFYCRQKS